MNHSGSANSTTTSPSAQPSSFLSEDLLDIPHPVLLAHAVCGAFTAMLFIPITILLPRLARGFSLNRRWFPVHVSFATFALLGGLATWGIAKVKLGDAGSHGLFGSSLFVLLIAQVALGSGMKWYNHIYPRHPSKGRHPLNYIHVLVGLAALFTGFGAVYTGWSDQWPKISGTGDVGRWVKVTYWAVVATVVTLYIIGLIFLLPRQRRMEKAMSQRATFDLSLMDGSKGYIAVPDPRIK